MFVKSRGKIDYEKLTRDFGSTKISAELLERMRKLTVGSGALGCPGALGVFMLTLGCFMMILMALLWCSDVFQVVFFNFMISRLG